MVLVVVSSLLWVSSSRAIEFLFSSEEGFQSGASLFQKYDVISTDGTGTYTALYSGLIELLPPQVNIDALDLFNANNLIFSLAEDAVIQSMKYHKQDLLLWNGSAISRLWNGIANGLPQNVNLDAVDIVSLSPLIFSFSLEEDASLPNIGRVSKSDVINFTTGSGFTRKEFDAVARGIPAQVNLDGFSKVLANQWVMSFDAEASIVGNRFAKADLVAFNPLNSTFASSPSFDATANGIPMQVNLDAVDILLGHFTGVDIPWELF